MPKAKPSDFVLGIDSIYIRDILGGKSEKFVFTDDLPKRRRIIDDIACEVRGGVKQLLATDVPEIRQFVGYGLRYFIDDGKVHYAVHLKVKENAVTGEVSSVLSLGIGEHLRLADYRRLDASITHMGDVVDLMAEAAITDEESAFDIISRLLSTRPTGRPERLGWVISSVNEKTSRHVGIVMGNQIRTFDGKFPTIIATSKADQFVGWFTADQLTDLMTEAGSRKLIYRHGGFEPWAQLIINGIHPVSEHLEKRYREEN